ncbi:phosphatase PAP2 family protein [Corallincola luteus]|uniref:Phosphatase PAP2 family protein n=1 Tax=Corallincola luteus TaxID=1775177 RepID=A0ABY2AK66_9GAMM|nr:phosphatase PAP2 family protein [Corallincola luteus]TCI01772.1 phosphatase PAP2 family protein [Corallincola luteus]
MDNNAPNHSQPKVDALPVTLSAKLLGDESPRFWLRCVVAVLMFIYFEMGYSWAKRHGADTTIYDAATALDAWLPQLPVFIIFYMLGYLFVFSPCFTLKRKQEFYWGTCCFFLILSISFLIFKTFPVAMDKTIAMGADGLSKLTRFQQENDTRFNNFPSLHVSLNLFAFLIFARHHKNWFWIILPIPCLIIASTVLVKQHLVADMIGGIVVALLAYRLFLWLLNRAPCPAWLPFTLVIATVTAVIAYNHQRLAKIGRIVEKFTEQTLTSIPPWIGIALLFIGLGWWWGVKRWQKIKAVKPS